MKVWCVFSLKSPQRCNPNDYTQHTIFNIKKKITLHYSKSAAMRFFQGTQEQVDIMQFFFNNDCSLFQLKKGVSTFHTFSVF